MAKGRLSRSDFNAKMCRRLKEAREALGLTQDQVAEKLGVPKTNYPKWENRSPLPHYLIPRACEALHMDAWFLLTGRFSRDDAPGPNAGRPFHEAQGHT